MIDNTQAESDEDPLGGFLEFLEVASREILASQLTVADVVEYIEREAFSPNEGIGVAKVRYIFGIWLVRWNSLPEALQQFQTAEAEFVSNLSSPEGLDALVGLACVLSGQAQCYIALDPSKALPSLDRAVDCLFQGVPRSAAEPIGASSNFGISGIGIGKTLLKARFIFSQTSDEELRFALAMTSIRYAQVLTLEPYLSVDDALEASLWFKLGHDCIMVLPREHRGAMALFPECMNLSVLFFTAVLPSLNSELVEEELESKFSDLFSLIGYYMSDDITGRIDYILEQAKQSTPPQKLVSEMMMVSNGDLDEATLLSLREAFDPEENQLDIWLCTFLLGRRAVRSGEAASGIEIIQDSWGHLSKLLAPGHIWRTQVQMWIAHAYLELNDSEKSLSSAIASLVDGLVSGLPWEVFFTQYMLIARSCVTQNTAASIFFGKLAALGWLKVFESSESIQVASLIATPPEGFLLELSRWMSTTGRLGEALQVAKLNEAHDFEASARPRFAAETSISLTSFESFRLEAIRGTVEMEFADLHQKAEMIQSVVTEIVAEFEREEERFAQEIADLQATLTAQQMDQLPYSGEGAALVSFCSFREAVDILLITKGGAEAIQVDTSEEEISKTVFRFLKCVRSPEADSIWISHRDTAKDIYDTLFGGRLREKLEAEKIRCLAILAAGVFRFLPFAALHDGSSYLLERFSIVLVPEFQIDLRMAPVLPRKVALLGAGFAEENHESEGLKALPGVGKELNFVRHFLASLGSREPAREPEFLELRDENFDLDGVTQAFDGSYSIIHIASHFSADPSDSGNSILWLGNGQALLVEEFRQRISNLEGVDLIVLSACDTGQPAGRWQRSKISSFPGLLHGLGAHSVLNTLWPVADFSTSLLVALFYRFLFKDYCGDKNEALRKAQLCMLQNGYAHPYYWAAFVLSGNWCAFTKDA